MSSPSTELKDRQCSDLAADFAALDQDAITAQLQLLDPAWQLNAESKTISNAYAFKNYYQTMAFVNVVAQIAHQQDHHPDLLVSYNRCMVTFSTHSVGGISIKDFICAAKINASQKL